MNASNQYLHEIAKLDPRLREVVNGQGLHGVGAGTRAEADRLGKIWVGDGAREMSDGTGLISADGLRQYRFPKYKPNAPRHFNPTGTQANFEKFEFDSKEKRVRTADGHMIITD